MTRIGRGGRRTSRGQALVEFALVLPIIVLVIFATVDLGRGIYAYNTVANAARDAARVAIVNQTLNAATATCDTLSASVSVQGCAVASSVALGVTTSDVTVTYMDATDTTACGSPLVLGCLAEVTITYGFQPITPVISTLWPSITMSSTSKVPIERVCSNPPSDPSLTQC